MPMMDGLRRPHKVRPGIAAVISAMSPRNSSKHSKKDPPLATSLPRSKVSNYVRPPGVVEIPTLEKVPSKKQQRAASSKFVAAALNLTAVIPAELDIQDVRQMATMYNVFLNMNGNNDAIKSLKLSNKELTCEYRSFKSVSVHFVSSIVVVMLIFVCVVADVFQDFFLSHTSAHPSAPSMRDHPVELSCLVMGLVAVALFVTTSIHRFVHNNNHRDEKKSSHPLMQRVRDFTLKLDQSCIVARLLNDGFIVFLALFTGLAAVARVTHGPSTNRYSQLLEKSGFEGGCDLATDIAMESYAICLFVVLLPQVFCKGASRTAICLSW
jgi:hypothetical protein